MVFDKLFGPSKETVQKKLDKEREEAEAKSRRQNDISVDNYTNDSSADIHRQKAGLEQKKQDELRSQRNATKNKLEELEQEAYIKKMALINEADKQKVKQLKEEERRQKELEAEHKQAAEEQKRQTDGLRKDQQDTASETNKMNDKNSKEALKQAKDTEVLRNKLTEEEKDLKATINREFLEKEREIHATHLDMEKQMADKEEQNYQEARTKQLEFYQNQQTTAERLFSARVSQAEVDERRVVNAEIVKLQNMTVDLKKYSEEITEKLGEKMEDEPKECVKLILGLINKELDKLSATLMQLDRKSAKLPDLEAKTTYAGQVKTAKTLVNEAKTTTTAIKRELKPSVSVFNMEKSEAFEDKIAEIIAQIDNFALMDDGAHQTRARILEMKDKRPGKQIEN